MINRLAPLRGLLIIGVVLVGNLIAGIVESVPTTTSDGRSLRWDRFDVTVSEIDTTANRFTVTEDYTLTIIRGPFSYGFAEIPTNRLERISNVQISQNGTPLRNSCSSLPGTFCTSEVDNNFSITYYFLSSVLSNETINIRLAYTVDGALRSYADGDQLYWVAVPGDRSFPVLASRVTVIMPPGVSAEKFTSYPNTWTQTYRGNTLTWESPGSLGTNGSVEVRVQYPHNPAMPKPGWQRMYDLEQTYLDRVQPVVTLGLGALSALLAIGGVLWVIIRYRTHGRDPQALVVPEYLTEPPSEELPGVVGVLLDEQADMRDIMGTLIDLARRGYLVIEQKGKESLFGLVSQQEFTFHRTDKEPSELTEYERILFRGIFRNNKDVVSLSELRNKFYTSIPAIKHQLYAEVVKRGYFARSPEKTRQYWFIGSLIGLAAASLLFWVARAASIVSPLLIGPPIALGLVSAAGLLAANYMPAKTLSGSQEAARWRAFRRYLDNIGQFGDIAQAAQRFDQYVAYAVAFGLDQELFKTLVPAMTSMPTWYYPTHLGGPWQRGYRRGQPMTGGNLGGGLSGPDLGGLGGLNSMSESLTQGLNAMSKGMTQMLNDASRVMTSQPSSSGKGGGGWSGGGSRGGGGSGGGSRGFG